MLFKHLNTFKSLIARVALEGDIGHGALVGRHHLSFLLIKNILRNWCELSNSSLGVINMELSRQMKFVVYTELNLMWQVEQMISRTCSTAAAEARFLESIV